MRTTLDLDADVLLVIEELARQGDTTMGHASSNWLASLVLRQAGACRRWIDAVRDRLVGLPRRVRRAFARGIAIGAPLVLLVWLLMAPSADAAAIVVGSGGCTLAAAITNANGNDQSGSTLCAAGGGTDTIQFAIADGTYGLVEPLPAITSPITIQGNGNTTIKRTGGPAFRVLTVAAPRGNLTLRNATISGGSVDQSDEIGVGAGIYIAEGQTAHIAYSTISDNWAPWARGGGIANSGTLTVTHSTIAGNSGHAGGGVLNLAGTLLITHSHVIDNWADSDAGGSGINNYSGEVTVNHCTVSGNSAGDGGGIKNYDQMSITGSTISGNDFSGITVYGSTLSLAGSTVSGNSVGIEIEANGTVMI